MAHSISYWEQSAFFDGYDIIIVGSGIVGLSSALYLKKEEPRLKIGILESGFLPSGASTRNAGFACFGSISEAIEAINASSEDEFLTLVEMRWKGLQKLRENLGDHILDFRNYGGYEVFRTPENEFAETCISKISYFNRLLSQVIGRHDIYSVSNDKIAAFGLKSVKHLIENKYEAQIDTGRMMKGLIAKVQSLGVSIFNNCEVTSIRASGLMKTLVTNQATFKTKKVIVATNAFITKLFPDLDVMPGRGQVLVTEPIPGLKLQGAFHYNRGYTYFRNINGRILLGGGRDLDLETERTYEPGHTDLVQNYLENLLSDMIFPDRQVKIDYRWSGIMGFGRQLTPIVRELEPNLFCAVRCSGMGVAMGTLLGEKAAALTLRK